MRYALIPCFLSLLLVSACFGTQKPAPVSTYGRTSGEGSAGVHIVTSGETLYTISNRYQIEMRDIAHVNRLRAPFRLAVGQRLRLPPPQQYRVRRGDTLYGISRLFNTSTSAVARQNNLKPPYRLVEGQVLRMPSLSAASQPVAPRSGSGGSSRVMASSASDGKSVVKPVQKPAIGSAAQKPQKTVSGTPDKDVGTATPPRADTPVSRPVKISATPPPRTSAKFLRPVEGRIISSYGPKADGLHNDGINIAAPRGTPVMAAENGVIVYVGNELKGSGNLILIRHDGGFFTAYAHLERFSIARGATVKRGQTIGAVGSTGAVSSPQLHFELRKGTQAIDPKSYISG